MMQYVKIQERFDRFEDLDFDVTEAVKLAVDQGCEYGVEIIREYPKGYTGSTSGFIIVNIPKQLAFTGEAMTMLLSALEQRKAKGSRPLNVELIIKQADNYIQLIFSVPDVWVKMDVPTYSEYKEAKQKSK